MKKQIVHLFVFNTLADWETGFAVAGSIGRQDESNCP
jgi:hypothetical protein